VLAAIGIYGVMVYSVAERTREIGIRMALGASAGDVFRLVALRALVLFSAGLALGLAGSVAATRYLASSLYEVTATDPTTYIAVSAMLGAVALLACLVPTRRAVGVNPTVALRYE
jgi:putative ABC transport system permease protein